MKRRVVKKMLNNLSTAEIVSNPKLLKAIANDPKTDEEYNRVMKIFYKDISTTTLYEDEIQPTDVYQGNRVSHSEAITHANLKESPTSKDWNSLMAIGENRANIPCA